MRTVGVSLAGLLVGEFVPNAKLTTNKVKEMRRLYGNGGVTYAELGRLFGVHMSTAARVIKGKTWVTPVARMVCQVDAEDVVRLSAGEGRLLLAKKAGATAGSVDRAMKEAGVSWDGNVRKQKHTHCKRGHALSGHNLITRANGAQACRECCRSRWREFARKKRIAQRAGS